MYPTSLASAQRSGNNWFNTRPQSLTGHQAFASQQPQSLVTDFRQHLSDSYDVDISDDDSDDDVVVTGSQATPHPRRIVDVNEATPEIPLALTPGSDVELEDHSFIHVVEHVTSDPYIQYIKGYRLLLQNHPELLMPERKHELVQLVKIDDNLETDTILSTVPVDFVIKNCKIVFTNQQYKYLNYCKDVLGYGRQAEEKPIYFCRWMSADTNVGTDDRDPNGPPLAGRIEHLRSHQADYGTLITTTGQHIELSIPDHEVRKQWRGKTNLGGSHDKVQYGLRKQKYTFGDAFAGAGGASSGAYSARLNMKFAFDIDKWATDTYELNFAHTGTQILQTDVSDFIRTATVAPNEWLVDMLHLSPPCQPFCGANRNPNKEDDAKNIAALARVTDLLEVCKPRIATLEEAKSLTDIDKRAYFHKLVCYFIKKGYSVQWKALDLSRFGVPQTRKRTIIIASGPGEKLPAFLRPTHGNVFGFKAPPTIGATLAGIPVDAIHNDEISGMKQDKLPYQADCLCQTILTRPKPYHWHPSGTRRFSIREYAALQTFGHHFVFAGSCPGDRLRQIGNAVPPMFAEELFRHLRVELRTADMNEIRGYAD